MYLAIYREKMKIHVEEATSFKSASLIILEKELAAGIKKEPFESLGVWNTEYHEEYLEEQLQLAGCRYDSMGNLLLPEREEKDTGCGHDEYLNRIDNE